MNDHRSRERAQDSHPTRRVFLGGAVAVSVGALAGCMGDDDGPDAISIPSEQACDQCSMEIGRHPGPNGQAHYDDAEALFDEDRPAMFCASTCAYVWTFEREDEGHDPTAFYLTDYSSVDYSVDEDAGIVEISSHLEEETFASATDLALVVDSEVEGAMGPSMIGFSDADDAEEFQAEWGGDVYDHDDVTPDLVMSMM
ncbi:nitrous oxide reductase accessory protein NosL [Natrarchaeobaculum sulfurireducens]|nr:nitrous oxide reductase accessory protein NosL [Natrarchaeobaculum sulfurireducens]AXR78381.1 NosL family protein [Natrarchaeobaculum sulfurireducens]